MICSGQSSNCSEVWSVKINPGEDLLEGKGHTQQSVVCPDWRDGSMVGVCVWVQLQKEFSIVEDTPSFLLIFSSARVDQTIQLTAHKEKDFL